MTGDVFVTDGVVTVDLPAGADPVVFRADDCTVIPGLIEGHAHLCFDATPGWRATYDTDTPGRMLLRMAAAARRMLEAGITTARDLGAPTELAIELRNGVRAGLVPGPDLVVSGAPITTTGGHCHFMGGEADGELEVRKRVRALCRAGVDWIKVMATGGNMTRGTNVLAPQYTVAELTAIVEESHRLGRRVAAHCHGSAGIRFAVEAGVDTLEHCSFQGAEGYDYDPALARRIADQGIVISPTVSVAWLTWADGRRRERGAILRDMLDAGCRFIMSTDCGIPGVPHEALVDGMKTLSSVTGLSPVDALRLATSGAAQQLGLSDRGVLEAGRRADLLVVGGDPTVDPASLHDVRAVVAGGRLVRSRRT